jgi:endonuclease/exonuclease/phosphatase family metal-dependent hydrolase
MDPQVLTVYKSPFNKIRLGKANDGGYVVADIPNVKYELLLAGGISDDISFENDFINNYNPTLCVALDGTINGLPSGAHNKIRFFKKNIGIKPDEANLHDIINVHNSIFVKMDIEGGEIPWVNSLNESHLNKMDQIVMEFHFPFSANENRAFNLLNKYFYLIHFHPNNCCGKRRHNGVIIPNVFECTYVHKKHFTLQPELNTESIPTNIDMCNLTDFDDIYIKHKPFVHPETILNEVKFMTYNLEYGMQGYDLHRVIDIIKKSGADIVAIQEATTETGHVSTESLASLLCWNYVTTDTNGSSSIISKWDISLVTQSTWFISARVQHPSGNAIYVVSGHFTDEPYQPNQAAGIQYGEHPFINNSTELVAAAYASRGVEIDNMINEMVRLRLLPDSKLVLMGGDMNEPSHLDWTPRAVESGLIPFDCPFPNSLNMFNHGFVDVYRAIYPDEVENKGITFPSYEVDYEYRPDRIDFIYAGSSNLETIDIKDANVMLGDSPSDHHPVISHLRF